MNQIQIKHTLRSNCLIVALYAWYLSPSNTKISMKWRKQRNSLPHFYWTDTCTNSSYHFIPLDDNLSMRQMLWFDGVIQRRNKYNDFTEYK